MLRSFFQLFIGAMNAFGNRYQTFPRFYRHAFLLAFDALESGTIHRIFATLSEWHFSRGFSDKVTMLAKVFTKQLTLIHTKQVP